MRPSHCEVVPLGKEGYEDKREEYCDRAGEIIVTSFWSGNDHDRIFLDSITSLRFVPE